MLRCGADTFVLLRCDVAQQSEVTGDDDQHMYTNIFRGCCNDGDFFQLVQGLVENDNNNSNSIDDDNNDDGDENNIK